jgi:hypothetical protein
VNNLHDRSTLEFLKNILKLEMDQQLIDSEEMWQSVTNKVSKMIVLSSIKANQKKECCQSITNALCVADSETQSDTTEKNLDIEAMYLHFKSNPYLGWCTLSTKELLKVFYLALDLIRFALKSQRTVSTIQTMDPSKEDWFTKIYFFWIHSILMQKFCTQTQKGM